MPIFIAEISNHHYGDMDKAKELILRAKEAGAHLVKGQAFKVEDMLFSGTMPEAFYKKCELTLSQYQELIEFGNRCNVPVFFSIISESFSEVRKYQSYQKLHAKRASFCELAELKRYDKKKCFVSLASVRKDFRHFSEANILYATEYFKGIDLHDYEYLKKFYGKDIGVSYHTNNLVSLESLSKFHKIPVVEKHFFLGDQISHDGIVYRDCLHSSSPLEFSEMVKKIK